MAKFGTVAIDLIVDVKHKIVLAATPDGHAEVWLLYRAEPFHPDGPEEREMNLWLRRCDVFSSRVNAIAHLDTLIGAQVRWRPYNPIFAELWVGRLGQHRWWLVSAPLDPPGGER
jgi:hypothetical protein